MKLEFFYLSHTFHIVHSYFRNAVYVCIYSPNFDSFLVRLDPSIMSMGADFVLPYVHGVEGHFMRLLCNWS